MLKLALRMILVWKKKYQIDKLKISMVVPRPNLIFVYLKEPVWKIS